MTEVRMELPVEIAETIARRAASLGTTPERWLEAMVQDVVADLPEDGDDGADDWIAR